MRTAFPILATLLAVGLEGCTPSAPVHAPTPAPAAKPAPAPDARGPVAEPPGVALVARVRHPGQIASQAFGWLGLAIDPSHLVPSFGKKPVPIDLESTLDVLVVTDDAAPPHTQVVLSVPMRSVDEMKDALGSGMTWRSVGQGAFVLEAPSGSGLPGAKAGGAQCAIAPSSGDAKARLVCSEGNALDRVLPYLLHTLPETAFEHDVFIEARRSFLSAHANDSVSSVGQTLSSAVPGAADFMRALDAIDSEARRFASEIESMELTMDFDARGVRAEAHLAAKRASMSDSQKNGPSLLSQVLMTPGQGAPEAFFRLPADSDFAFFGAGSPRPPLDALRSKVAPLRTARLPQATVTTLGDGGLDLAAMPWTLSVSMGAPEGSSPAGRGIWLVAATQSPFAHVAEIAHGLVSAKGADKAKSTDTEVWKLREGKVPAGLPKESMALDLTFPVAPPENAVKKGLPKKLTATAHFVLVGQGPWTWLAVSTSETTASDLLREVTAATPARTLADRPDAAWFRAHPFVSGSDLALRATIDPTLLEAALGATAKSVRLPAPGPILVATEVLPGKGRGGADELVLRVDAPASLSVGIFLGVFKDVFSPTAGPH